ncbi:unnamed protein product [Mycena citricolor]|uniref:t-SNARE coiled-coil homology domain-containing protein n=1 Tax=Mycena citricolor TaxID=2018698 RepID=A0AAD2K5M3_9AGAR|nr:unnamed protein product [Mycena citricolor]
MSFFKRKDNNKSMIPPVQSEQPRDYGNSTNPRPVRSSASTYVASRDGDPYASRTPSYPSDNKYNEPHKSNNDSYRSNSHDDGYQQPREAPRDRYGRNNGVGDVYSRPGEKFSQQDQDRAALFSGFNPEKSGSGRFFDGADVGRDPPTGEETEEDVEGIKKQTRVLKQESANSTRNALRLAREAEDTARNTLGKLGTQSERLANTERHLDVSKGHSARADDKTDELRQLNRSIFRPVITFNKDAKRAAQEAKIQARYDDERNEREKTMMDIRDSQDRLGQAQTYGREEVQMINGRRFRTEDQVSARKEQRKRFQFESTASDDEVEDEIDDNLDEIGDATKRLKALGMAMGQELDRQNQRIDVIEQKTVNLDNKIVRNTDRVTQAHQVECCFYAICHIHVTVVIILDLLPPSSFPAAMVSEYERQRARNIERNKALLLEIGLKKPLVEPKEVRRPKPSKKRKLEDDYDSAPPSKVTRVDPAITAVAPDSGGTLSLRRSGRNAGKAVDYKTEKTTSSPIPISFTSGIRTTENEGRLGKEAGTKRIHDPKVFGSIPGVTVGTWWESREGCSADAIHAPWVAGISGGHQGAYSVALSGGYEDDVDCGYALIRLVPSRSSWAGLTLPSGLLRSVDRDQLRTAPQSSDQTFENSFNKALQKSSETKKPIRVIRGYKLNSRYAPYEGYRYDGLYRVEKAWQEPGTEGFLVCKFAFKRLPGQPDLPVREDVSSDS